jgi:multiple sugar transport system substrate-binding protein
MHSTTPYLGIDNGLRGRMTRRGFLAGSVAGAGLALLRLCQEARPAAARPAAPSDAGADRTARQAATPTVQAGVTLRWLLPAQIGYERDIALAFVQSFEQQTPGVRIEATFEPWASYEASLARSLAGEAPPEIVQVGANVVQELGLRGLLRDVAPMMQRDQLSRADFFPFLIQQLTDFRTRTRLWAVPKDGAVYVVYYNKAYFDWAGVPYPRLNWTLDEFRATARQLTFDRSGNSATSSRFVPGEAASWGVDWGSHLADTLLPGSDLWQTFAWGQAGPWFSDDLTRVYLDDPGHVAFLEQIVAMHCQDRSILHASEPGDPGARWRQGVVAMGIAHYAQSYFYEQEQRTFAYDIVPAPAGPRGQFNASTCNGWAIPARAAHQDEAWAFISFLLAPAQQLALVRSKRWGAALKSTASALAPADNQPASFKAALYDPMFGQSSVQVRPIAYPPFLEEMRQIWQAEFGTLLTCGVGQIGEAAKRAQPRIQALLDKAWSI